jgi:hypothetical protein
VSRVRQLRATKAALVRHHPNQPDLTLDVDHDLAEAKVAEYIERTAATLPGLTSDARSRLAVLLLTSGAA